jgi:hypothetical protein
MIQDPAYYRDLLYQILQESEDDIPAPPTRKELIKNKFYRDVSFSSIHRELWLGLDWFADDHISVEINLGGHAVLASGYPEGDTMDFSSYFTIDMESDNPANPFNKFFTSPGAAAVMTKNLIKYVSQQLNDACRERFGIEADFRFIDWRDNYWQSKWTSYKFGLFLANEFQPMVHLIKEFTANEQAKIVDSYIGRGERI